ncbi:MAG TPA: hypothetical protein VG322_04180 [Candidatus Acidoferrales bacterium]|jgi:hypothetical protein|nr:hypothetical protein [Candidatus Acidoferrales bacterium]
MSASQTLVSDPARQLLRHTVATLAYRGGKSFRGVPDDFAAFRVGEKSRTPGQTIAHISDLLDWAISLVKGKQEWHDSEPLPWTQAVERFYAALAALDAALASDAPLGGPPEKIFQGPIADAFTHVGQISTLRRLAGYPVRAENYLRAQITMGRVGPEQAPPKQEFD